MGCVYYTYMPSPVGKLLLAGEERALKLIGFEQGKGVLEPRSDWEPSETAFREAIRQLTAYFDRKLRKFNLPLAPEGTPFQRIVWDQLLGIPYGITVTYAELARTIGRPDAVRAVGSANGRNPLPIVVPCHRVVGSGGSLTGYGGGLRAKEFLLKLEDASIVRNPWRGCRFL